MSEVDVEYVSALLGIAEKCTGHSGKLGNLQSWAIGELIAINGELKNAAVAEAKAQAEAEQKATGVPEQPGVPSEPTPDNPEVERRV